MTAVPGSSRQTPKEVSDNYILEAEHFHVTVEAPSGKTELLFTPVDSMDDDDYFHLACHIDTALKVKIEKGEFVNLERLLLRQQLHKSGGDHLEWITKDGMTFLAPANDCDNCINGIKRWDQAFRVYATIYCGAHPERAGKIWQYIYVIHSAVVSYLWDNVACYDYTFRQMMHDRPGHKWSKMYLQLWQLAMRDPINKVTNQQYFGGQGSAGSNRQIATPKHKTWKDNYCWGFNRTGKCNRVDCNFDNRCSFGSAWNTHGFNTC